jgi:hypothetical protein
MTVKVEVPSSNFYIFNPHSHLYDKQYEDPDISAAVVTSNVVLNTIAAFAPFSPYIWPSSLSLW